MSRLDFAEGCCGKVFEGFFCQRAEFHLASCSNVRIDKCFDGFGKDVGDGGIVRSNRKEHIQKPAKHVGFAFDTAAAATASASASAARGGKGVPAGSRSVGKGRRIEAVKNGGRDGLIRGDGRDNFGFDGHAGNGKED